jgi:hypothetical protein
VAVLMAFAVLGVSRAWGAEYEAGEAMIPMREG